MRIDSFLPLAINPNIYSKIILLYIAQKCRNVHSKFKGSLFGSAHTVRPCEHSKHFQFQSLF